MMFILFVRSRRRCNLALQPSGVDDLSAFVVAGRTCATSLPASVVKTAVRNTALTCSLDATSRDQTRVVRMKLSSIRARANRPNECEEIERHEVGP